MEKKRRVVITGMGAVSPLGTGLEKYWDGLINGKSGVRKLDWVPENINSRIGAEPNDFNPEEFIDKKESRRMDKFLQYGLVAGIMAYKDSGLENSEYDKDRVGATVGSGIGGLQIFQDNHQMYLDRGKVSPFFIPLLITNMISGRIAIEYGFRGPNFSISSACATSNHSIGVANDFIRLDKADVMFAGGSEAALTYLGIQGFAIMKAISTRNDEPEKASRPFDVDRDGFVVGSGAGVIVLEELEHAKRRGARIYAELIGVGMSDDAYNMVAPNPDGAAAALSIKRCIEDAGINPEEVDYINAHGTSTPLGDIAEIKAIKASLGEKVAKKVLVSSTKSMIGHCLGAAGGLEIIATILGMQHGYVLPTMNLDNQDPQIDLDCVPKIPRKADINIAISNSFGFGGHNSTIAIKKFME